MDQAQDMQQVLNKYLLNEKINQKASNFLEKLIDMKLQKKNNLSFAKVQEKGGEKTYEH